MYDHTFHEQVQTSRSDIVYRPHIKWAVSLVILHKYYGHFNLPPGFVWAYMG